MGIVIAIIGVLSAIAVPSFAKARARANMRACHANQKTISGAVEMYNMDNGVSVTTLDEALANELVAGGYLTAKVNDPGGGRNSFNHYQLTEENSGITCTEHGSRTKGSGAAVASAGGGNSTSG